MENKRRRKIRLSITTVKEVNLMAYIGYAWKYSNRNFWRSDKIDKYIVKPYSEEFINKIREHRENKDIYITAFQYSISMEEVSCEDAQKINKEKHIGNLFFDFDSKNIDEALTDVYKLIQYFAEIFILNSQEYKVFFSGKKGFYLEVYHRALGIEKNYNWANVYKYFAFILKEKLKLNTLDLNIYEWRRLIRIPFSIHGDTGLYKNIFTLDDIEEKSVTEIVNLCQTNNERYDYLFLYPEDKKLLKNRFNIIQQLTDKCNETKQDYNTDKPKYISFEPPKCIRTMEYRDGFRNKVIFQKAIFYRNQGMEKQDVINLIKSEIGEFPTNEIKRTVESAYINKHYDIGCKHNTRLKELLYNKICKCSDFCIFKQI